MFLAREQLHVHSQWLVMSIALLAGLMGALLTLFLQKFAIALAGFGAGGYLCAIALERLNLERFTWIGFVVGGIIGSLLLLTVFEWALIVLSSLVGAAFLADGIAPEQNNLCIFVVALVIGLTLQSFQMPKKRKEVKERD